MKQLLITIILSMLLALPAFAQETKPATADEIKQVEEVDEWAEEENSGMTYDNVYIQVGKRKKAADAETKPATAEEIKQVEEVDEWAEEENSGMTYDNVYIQVGKRKKAAEDSDDKE